MLPDREASAVEVVRQKEANLLAQGYLRCIGLWFLPSVSILLLILPLFLNFLSLWLLVSSKHAFH